ncbi:hypothetical protein [Microvirga sp. Mcv34]|uniref:hypothetical protein n=1 Tax=Microvirga sp. Mcv34 TaxID=2926016 RepID=UPI0021C9F069|nr:hypothetical protein [Microvirga sp. Mcv34]
MDAHILLDRLISDPAATLKSLLIIGHLIGLILGLGTATLLDIFIVKFIIRRIVSEDHYTVISFFSKIVVLGLIILWMTGIGFLVFYSYFDPIKLSNQKIWAKLIVVSVLTLNGLFIHRTVLPLIRENIGRMLFDGFSSGQRFLLLTSGGISATSWYVPFILGAFPQFNFLPVLPVVLIYVAILLTVIAATQLFTLITTPYDRSVIASHAGEGSRKPLAALSQGNSGVLTSRA